MIDHPITPPPELVQQWNTEGRHQDYCTLTESIAARAAQWGADTELEACCEYVYERLKLTTVACIAQELRADRRPKPPSLKEQASSSFEQIVRCYGVYTDFEADVETIRRALEALPND